MRNSPCPSPTKDNSDGLAAQSPGQASKVTHIGGATANRGGSRPSILLNFGLHFVLEILEGDDSGWIGFVHGRSGLMRDDTLDVESPDKVHLR